MSENAAYQKSVLDNGLRVLTCTMPHTRSVSLVIFVGTGSRYERPQEAGISHFLEHLYFKGTERRPNARQISETIEGVGGIMNASTDRELTTYWCKVARPHFQTAFDLLVDMLRHSLFQPSELEKERQVILEELSMSNDFPTYRVDALIDEVLWPDQPLGRDVGGTRESVQAITREMILDYMNLQYSPSNTVVSVAGNVSHQEVMEQAQELLRDWPVTQPTPWEPATDGQMAPRMKLERRRTDQAHICLGLKGLSSSHPDRYSLSLLNVVLGEGMSSRLFQELREKQGLAYDVHSSVSHLLDTGSLIVYAGVDPKKARRAVATILQELNSLRDGVPQEELDKAKELSKGRLLLRMEDSRSVAGWAGVQELLLDRVLTVDEVVERVDAVTTEDLKRVATQLLVQEKLNLAVVGPYRSESGFQSILKL